jgi:DeoR/GlpR family transcriptional regulator of sugar metabolism
VNARLGAARRDEILSAARRQGAVDVHQLADQLSVSTATIRRDLAWLAERGKLTRVHGGATVADEPPFAQVEVRHREAKDSIGRRAAELVNDGETVLLDIGTTTLQVARHLHGRPITVLTSSLAVCDELIADTAVQLILLGGLVRRNYRSLVGLLTEEALNNFRADRLFLGASGVTVAGSVMDTTIVEIPIKRAMLRVSSHPTLVIDSSKLPGSGVARICGVDSLETLITDAGIDHAAVEALSRHDVKVEVACS